MEQGRGGEGRGSAGIDWATFQPGKRCPRGAGETAEVQSSVINKPVKALHGPSALGDVGSYGGGACIHPHARWSVISTHWTMWVRTEVGPVYTPMLDGR